MPQESLQHVSHSYAYLSYRLAPPRAVMAKLVFYEGACSSWRQTSSQMCLCECVGISPTVPWDLVFLVPFHETVHFCRYTTLCSWTLWDMHHLKNSYVQFLSSFPPSFVIANANSLVCYMRLLYHMISWAFFKIVTDYDRSPAQSYDPFILNCFICVSLNQFYTQYCPGWIICCYSVFMCKIQHIVLQ